MKQGVKYAFFNKYGVGGKTKQYPLRSVLLTCFACFWMQFGMAQIRDAILTLHDSTQFEGYADLTKNNKIKFRMNLEDDADLWDHEEVYQIRFKGYPSDATYRYGKIRFRDKMLLLLVLEDGPMGYFGKEVTRIIYEDGFGGGLDSETGFPPENHGYRSGYKKVPVLSRRYLKLPKEETLISLGAEANPSKALMREWFAGCAEVLDEIEVNENYKIADLVWQYNRYCAAMEED